MNDIKQHLLVRLRFAAMDTLLNDKTRALVRDAADSVVRDTKQIVVLRTALERYSADPSSQGDAARLALGKPVSPGSVFDDSAT